MPCLQAEALQEPMASDRETSNPSSADPPCPSREPSSGEGSVMDQPVVTSAGWFFSPLWSPGAKTHRWRFGSGVKSDKVEVWLDDHATREMEGGSVVGAIPSPQTSRGPSRSPSDPSLLLGHRRDSSPLSSPSLLISSSASTPSLPRPPTNPQTFTPCLLQNPAHPQFSTRDRAGTYSPRSPRSPLSRRSLCCSHSPHSPHSSPRSPRRTGPCGRGGPGWRGEPCSWITEVLAGGSDRTCSVAELCQEALIHAEEVLAAERSSLSLIQQDQAGEKRLVQVAALTAPDSVKEKSYSIHAHLELVKGIMGYVGSTGTPINMTGDVFEDPRFTPDEDQIPDFRLRSVLCVPVKNIRQEVLGAALVLNKRNSPDGQGSLFSDQDEKVLSSHMVHLGLVLDNIQLCESSRQEAKRSQVLVTLARLLSEEHTSMDNLLSKMAATILPIARAQYCTIFIARPRSKNSFSGLVHMEGEEQGSEFQIYKRGCSLTEVDLTHALQVLGSKETQNVPDANQDPPTGSLVCCPIKNGKTGQIIAVCQLKNKLGVAPSQAKTGRRFNHHDVRLLEDFAVYCGLALQTVQTVQRIEYHRASQDVTQEVLSYHLTAPQEEIKALQEAEIPSAQSLHILDFSFSDIDLSEDSTTQATVRMFLDLNLIQDFNIEYKSLCQWVLSVKRGYRSNVPYHNWNHGLSTAQCMFAMLMATDQLQCNFSRLEVLALMIATLNHDLDHRGVSNSYIKRTHQPLAQLYGTSSLEHHHYDMCLFILNNPGSQILSGLSPEDYRRVLPMIEKAILATDLAIYMERRAEFFELGQSGVSWAKDSHRDLLRSMLMTASDICAITKPWHIQKRIAKLVATEFFAEGDKEREEFNIKPADMMNRDNSTRLPHMQVNYIDGLCHPLYQSLSGMFSSCSPLLDGLMKNRENWMLLAERGDEGGEEE
ncbi:cGMP-specific 3',5'-cyclic phosphodiesterase isoform X2 [Esox lucius]|uniref:cGMP-specific 3',5'-cyclic phosphodiesterase isoform X2 n=1 Tax=Esox lucius TaxID=8010 RepID=UPI0014773717|nr:cGMP-specific 3',5'-cyclic phosphodiesterase isoform X2 [Esox lucius]